MLKKSYSTTGKVCRVTFKYGNPENAGAAVLAGSFNEWSTEAVPMKRLKDGSFSITISLQAGASYQYRYILDKSVWVNDPDADGYVANQYGEENAVVAV
ncbi:MAG: glycoside hydrolase [Desulfobulbus propionicus]|nr:MAG: glycoside hydrolase [Desulfobulbus propionicus]